MPQPSSLQNPSFARLILLTASLALIVPAGFADIRQGQLAESIKPADAWRLALTGEAIGDVNGDGYDDAAFEIGSATGPVYGAIQFGSATGLDPDATISDTTHLQAHFTAIVGDLNSDGYDDLVRFLGVYTPGGAPAGQPDIDRGYVIYGAAGGPDLGDLSNAYQPSTMNQDRSTMRTATSGDFNGDGHLELVMAGWEGPLWAEVPRVFVYDGTANGPATTYTRIAASDLTGRGTFGAHGPNHIVTGDFDGDGYDDLAVAVPILTYQSGTPDTYRGAIYVYYGSSSGIDPSSETRLHTASTTAGDNFANGLAAGDLNGDGIDDVVAGAAYDQSVTGCGYVGVYYGIAGGRFIDGVMDELLPDCATGVARFGTGLDIAEVTGDGYDDLVIGSANSPRILRGSADGVSLSDGWVVCRGGWGMTFGDFDGDGLSDLLAGSRQWLGADQRLDLDCDGAADGPVCFEDDFEDGDTAGWTLTGIGNANQESTDVVDDAGNLELALTADGATAYYGADNAGFLYQELTGDFRIETDIDSTTMTTGKAWRKAGLMARASLDHLDIRLLAMVVPVQERLQFVAREAYGAPGNVKVATEVHGAPLALRLAIERVEQTLSVQYSLDGATWVTPATGLGGSIEIAELPETLYVGLAMVSNNISVTSTALFDDVVICPAP